MPLEGRYALMSRAPRHVIAPCRGVQPLPIRVHGERTDASGHARLVGCLAGQDRRRDGSCLLAARGAHDAGADHDGVELGDPVEESALGGGTAAPAVRAAAGGVFAF